MFNFAGLESGLRISLQSRAKAPPTGLHSSSVPPGLYLTTALSHHRDGGAGAFPYRSLKTKRLRFQQLYGGGWAGRRCLSRLITAD
jgi:hypothetical protein